MLKPNDTIALFTSGSPTINQNDADRAVQFCNSQLNLNAVYDQSAKGYTTPEQRAAFFLHYLKDPSIKMLWALRGGEGTADIIPYLHQHKNEILKLIPKPIIGFSDITALLIYFSQQYDWPVFHGPGLMQLVDKKINQQSIASVLDLIFKDKYNFDLDLSPLNELATQTKIPEAKLTGGNLTLLTISIKDIWEINCDNKIIFIEDVSEKPHAIYRSLKYLQRIGKFEKAKAIILGDFLGDNPVASAAEYDRVLQYFARDIELPVYRSERFGHGLWNLILPFSYF